MYMLVFVCAHEPVVLYMCVYLIILSNFSPYSLSPFLVFTEKSVQISIIVMDLLFIFLFSVTFCFISFVAVFLGAYKFNSTISSSGVVHFTVVKWLIFSIPFTEKILNYYWKKF
jgi:hypothetical protein